MALEIGSQARLVQPVIAGEIVDTEFNKTSKKLQHLVQWTEADGHVASRWFTEDQLEEVPNTTEGARA
jgi:hypothetical protein